MTQTEAKQLIKRTQCKLRPFSLRSPDQSSSASVIAMTSPKSGEKQVTVLPDAVFECHGLFVAEVP
jgi:hypothetical protein